MNHSTVIASEKYSTDVTFIDSNDITSEYSTVASSHYSGALTDSSNTFVLFDRVGDTYYYETIQVMVSQPGYYSFTSVSEIDLYGYLYLHDFDPFKLCKNLLKNDSVRIPYSNDFKIEYTFLPGFAYIIVVTTYAPNITGAFSIVSSGPGNVNLLPFNTMTTLSSTIMTSAISK